MAQNNLPPNWSWVKLGDVAKIKGGKRLPKGKTYSNKKTKYPYLRVIDFSNMSIDESDLRYLDSDTQEKIKAYTISSNDLYISIAGTIGSVGRIPANLDGANLTENAAKITQINNFDFEYLKLYLNSQSSQVQIKEKTIATTQPKLALFRIEKIKIPLPPLPEQKKIVEKIEELFSGLDSGVASLKKAKEQLRLYRQSVLAYAFSGKLTGDVKGETKNGELPKEWKWVKLGEVVKVVSGNTPKGLENISMQGHIPYYKVSDMNLEGNEKIMYKSNLYLTSEELNELKIKVYPQHTTIFPKRGGAILTNKKRLLSQSSAFDLNVMGTIPSQIVNYLYLHYWFIKLDLSTIYDGSNIPQINNKNVEPLDFPLPQLYQQTQIVEEIETRFSEADNLEKAIDDSLTKAETLRQSILKRAFEGKLV